MDNPHCERFLGMPAQSILLCIIEAGMKLNNTYVLDVADISFLEHKVSPGGTSPATTTLPNMVPVGTCPNIRTVQVASLQNTSFRKPRYFLIWLHIE